MEHNIIFKEKLKKTNVLTIILVFLKYLITTFYGFQNYYNNKEWPMNPGNEKTIFNTSKETIREAVNTLNELKTNTEEKFLYFGRILNGSYSQIKKILSSVQEATQIVASPSISKSIDDLEEVIGSIRSIVVASASETESNNSTMQDISEKLQDVYSRLGNFKYFVKQLRVLGLSTKIESARINDIDNGFDNLAQNVENLSNGVDEKVKQILHQLSGLFGIVNKISNNSTSVNNSTREISVKIIESAGNSAEVLSGKFSQSKENTEEIASYSDRISQILGDIVSSLQYQDITRQQIDHIIEALEGLFDSKNIHDFSPEEMVSEIYHIVKLQKAQLKSTRSQFLSATKNLTDEVVKVSEMSSNLIRMINELSNAGQQGEESFLENAREKIKQAIDILSENSSGDSELLQMIGQVNEIIKELSHFVVEVEDIGDEIELISLNSQIKAVRLGKEGASLGILAQNIQKLSVNAKEQTSALSNKFKSINSNINVFNDSLAESAQKVKKLSDNSLRGKLNLLFTELGETHNKVFEIVKNTNSIIDNVRQNIIEEYELSSFAQVSETGFDSVIENLEFILTNIDPGSIAHIQSRTSENLKNMYTMDSERDTHNSLDTEDDNTNDSFDSGSNDENESNEFGDNVELF